MPDIEPRLSLPSRLGSLTTRLRKRERRSGRLHAVGDLAVAAIVQTLRVKIWMTRLLLRSYVRVGAVMYRKSVPALTIRQSTAVVARESDILIAQRRLQRFISRVLAAKLTVALILAVLTLSYTNPYTPPGFEGYVYEHPRIIGPGGFKGSQIGPANFGISFWNNKVINLDVRPNTHNEKIEAVTRDSLAIALQFSAVLAITSGHVIAVVNDYGGEDWYSRFIQPRLRSLVQNAVQRRASFEVNAERAQIEEEVKAGLVAYLRTTPFVLCDLSETDMSYPAPIVQAVQRKLEAHQLLEEKETQVEIARKDAQIAVVKAQGQSEAQRLLAATLTPMYLQHEAIEAEAKNAASTYKTTVYVPTGPTGNSLIDPLALSQKGPATP